MLQVLHSCWEQVFSDTSDSVLCWVKGTSVLPGFVQFYSDLHSLHEQEQVFHIGTFRIILFSTACDICFGLAETIVNSNIGDD